METRTLVGVTTVNGCMHLAAYHNHTRFTKHLKASYVADVLGNIAVAKCIAEEPVAEFWKTRIHPGRVLGESFSADRRRSSTWLSMAVLGFTWSLRVAFQRRRHVSAMRCFSPRRVCNGWSVELT